MKLPPNFDKELLRSEIALSVAIVSLMSVGFSAWESTIKESEKAIDDISIAVEGVDNLITYRSHVSFDYAQENGINYFYIKENSNNGFSLSTEGNLTFNLTFNGDKVANSTYELIARLSRSDYLTLEGTFKTISSNNAKCTTAYNNADSQYLYFDLTFDNNDQIGFDFDLTFTFNNGLLNTSLGFALILELGVTN